MENTTLPILFVKRQYESMLRILYTNQRVRESLTKSIIEIESQEESSRNNRKLTMYNAILSLASKDCIMCGNDQLMNNNMVDFCPECGNVDQKK